jgi:hypothetical protein
VFAVGEPLECSWVENSSWADDHRLELDRRLVEAEQHPAPAQFLT